MRISDWSSDVCSSDLTRTAMPKAERSRTVTRTQADGRTADESSPTMNGELTGPASPDDIDVSADEIARDAYYLYCARRSEESRVGKECVSTCRSWWSTEHKKKKK